MPEVGLDKYVNWPNEVKVEGSLAVEKGNTALLKNYTINNQTKFDQGFIKKLAEEWNNHVDSSAKSDTKDINGNRDTIKATGKLVSIEIRGNRYAGAARGEELFDSKGSFVDNVYEEVKKAVNKSIEIRKENVKKKAQDEVELIKIDIVIK